uniref:Uncharacterized protein n=1 Tax=Glossina austeni TaxID=7395 RepID=A0A1A9VTH5_GLOAU
MRFSTNDDDDDDDDDNDDDDDDSDNNNDYYYCCCYYCLHMRIYCLSLWWNVAVSLWLRLDSYNDNDTQQQYVVTVKAPLKVRGRTDVTKSTSSPTLNAVMCIIKEVPDSTQTNNNNNYGKITLNPKFRKIIPENRYKILIEMLRFKFLVEGIYKHVHVCSGLLVSDVRQ